MRYSIHAPRLVISGLSGDSGKTLITLALVAEARSRGLPVAAFKKGPDYIDPAWLGLLAGRPARNLDTFLMGVEGARRNFVLHAEAEGLNLVEGNRGLYDGVDEAGTHSTATLAKALGAPVVLVLSAFKITRTAAALVLGCQQLDPELRIAGVILNRVATARQEALIRSAIESVCGVPVLGGLPRLAAGEWLPGRHLGLVPPDEHPQARELEPLLARLARQYLDFEAILDVARQANPIEIELAESQLQPLREPVRIGVVRDSAFTFYYPENLEALERFGAVLEPISALSDRRIPEDLDGLYIGGGFPETHAARLAANRDFLGSLRSAAEIGLPIYAECGGLMLLARQIRWQGATYRMAEVLPIDVEVCDRPQGHGYSELVVDRENPFFPVGTVLLGHEFHYSRVVLDDGQPPQTACLVRRGAGCFAGRDAIIQGRVWAAYTHLHALGSPCWAERFVAVARQYRQKSSWVGEASATSTPPGCQRR